jgi:hypothetical protein
MPSKAEVSTTGYIRLSEYAAQTGAAYNLYMAAYGLYSDENFQKVSGKIPESFRKVSVNYFLYFFTFMKHI